MTFEEWAADRVMSGMEREFPRDAWKAATKAEREACSELLEQQHAWISNVAAANIVRGRSNATPAEVLEKMRRRLELK